MAEQGPAAAKYEMDLFDPPPCEELICTICRFIFSEAVESPCQHVFCRSCIETWLDTSSNCPNCRKRVTKRTLKPALPLLKNMIAKLILKCENKENGCNQKIVLEYYESHKKVCDYERVPCRNTECKVLKMRKDMGRHLIECQFRLVRCGRDCELDLPYSIVRNHSCMAELKKRLKDTENMYSLQTKLFKELNILKSKQAELIKRLEECASIRRRMLLRDTQGLWSYRSSSDNSSDNENTVAPRDFLLDNLVSNPRGARSLMAGAPYERAVLSDRAAMAAVNEVTNESFSALMDRVNGMLTSIQSMFTNIQVPDVETVESPQSPDRTESTGTRWASSSSQSTVEFNFSSYRDSGDTTWDSDTTFGSDSTYAATVLNSDLSDVVISSSSGNNDSLGTSATEISGISNAETLDLGAPSVSLLLGDSNTPNAHRRRKSLNQIDGIPDNFQNDRWRSFNQKIIQSSDDDSLVALSLPTQSSDEASLSPETAERQHRTSNRRTTISTSSAISEPSTSLSNNFSSVEISSDSDLSTVLENSTSQASHRRKRRLQSLLKRSKKLRNDTSTSTNTPASPRYDQVSVASDLNNTSSRIERIANSSLEASIPSTSNSSSISKLSKNRKRKGILKNHSVTQGRSSKSTADSLNSFSFHRHLQPNTEESRPKQKPKSSNASASYTPTANGGGASRAGASTLTATSGSAFPRLITNGARRPLYNWHITDSPGSVHSSDANRTGNTLSTSSTGQPRRDGERYTNTKKGKVVKVKKTTRH